MNGLSPLGALLAGIGAGMAGTLTLSALSRLLPIDRQDRRSPSDSSAVVTRATPALALTEPQAPGPEGLAQQFAFKLAAGLFGADISGSARAWGLVVHLAYGSAWGALLGLVLATFPWRPLPAGTAFGLLVWGIGPALLVPAMRIMPPLLHQGARRILVLVAAHIAWGTVVAGIYRLIERRLT